MQGPFGTAWAASDTAFAGAAARFFELLKTFAAQPQTAPGRSPDWTELGAALAGQFEQWLKSSPAAGAAFAAAAGFPAGAHSAAAPPWPSGPIPLGPAARVGEEESAWELLMKLGQLQAQLSRHWGEIAGNAAQRFMARMRTRQSTDLTPESALALYEIWVECAEEAYAETVRREDFSHLQAQLTNTAMALLLAQRSQAEALARAWGLPTREETDALQRQIRELRQRLEERTPHKPRPAPRSAARAPRKGGAKGGTRQGVRGRRGGARSKRR